MPLLAAGNGCQKLELSGEVASGQEWRAPMGGGWQFRLVPIAGYSGWDLVVDTVPASGYPDALLLASPPYHSIGSRELGTTFGLRAQDALGWNPRPFRFLASREDYREARQQFAVMRAVRSAEAAGPGGQQAMSRLLALQSQALSGEFRILDARLTPGNTDAAPFAEGWALAYPRMPHTVEPSPAGKPSARGELHWIRFSVSLWLPLGWGLPAGTRAKPAACH